MSGIAPFIYYRGTSKSPNARNEFSLLNLKISKVAQTPKPSKLLAIFCYLHIPEDDSKTTAKHANYLSHRTWINKAGTDL